MTKTRTIAAVSAVALLLGAASWMFSSPQASHEIVIAPIHGMQR